MKLDKRLLRQLQGLRMFLALIIGLSILTAGLVVIQAHYLSQVINSVFLLKQSLGQVWFLLVSLLVVILGRALIIWANEITANKLASRVKTRLREQLYLQIQALGPLYTRGERSGELINTLVEGVEKLDDYFSQFLPQVFLTIIVPLAILIAVFSVDTLSGVVLLVTAPLLPFFMVLIGKMAESSAKRQWRLLSLMSAHFLDVLQGLTTLKLFGRSTAQKETIWCVSNAFRDATMKVLRVSFLSSLVLEMGATLSTAIIAVEIGLRLLYGQMAFQPAFFVLLLAPEFYLPLRTLGLRYHAAMNGIQAAQRIFAILEKPISISLPSEHIDLSQATVRFENVAYSYNGERPALRGVSFQIAPGQRVALVGPTGAGKSTVAQLLLRFIEPDVGTISIDGRDLKMLSPTEWRQQIAWVPQHPYLFNSSVAENIRLGCPEATRDEVIEAAQLAHAHEFIQALPQGYDTVVGEHGARLSGGQIQRLSLARAFLKNAVLLIFDEATSNLDPGNEQLIIDAYERLMQGRTVLIIAHHLNTIYRADQILVMDQGKLIETGTHQSLLKQSGLYKRLVESVSV